MSASDLVRSAHERLGTARERFDCCDTEFAVHAAGFHADAAATRARRTAHRLEARLNAFADDSAVAALNRDGAVDDEHVARVVERGLEYGRRTSGTFDVRQGAVEHDLKAYLRSDRETLPDGFASGSISVDGSHVTADVAVDLNGLAKGYIVDRVAADLDGLGRSGFVDGGGDMSPPTGLVAVESPYGDDRPLDVLDTDWNVATSGSYRRRRRGTDHIYDPRGERLGARNESVTVVAERDCMEADALATTLAALPVDDGLALLADWPGAEALVVHAGVFHRTEGFDSHVVDD